MKKTILLLALILIILTGCYDRKEINKMAIVSGFGFDLDENNDIVLTFQIINPQALGKKGGGAGVEPFWITQTKGEMVLEAIRKTMQHSPNKLYVSHNQIIVIGEELAKKGLNRISDLLLRDEEPREDAFLIVAEGKASDILQTKLPVGSIPAFEIADKVRSTKVSSLAVTSTVIDYAKFLTSDSPGIALGKISKSQDKLDYSGGALFEGDKLIDFLTETEARGYLWLKGDVKGGVIFGEVEEMDTKVVLEIVRSKSGFKPVILKNGQLSFVVQVAVVGRLGEFTNSKKITSLNKWPNLVKAIENKIKSEIKSVIDKAHYTHVDFLGFGNQIKKSLPKEWKKIETSWSSMFPEIPVSFNILVEIAGVGMVKQSP